MSNESIAKKLEAQIREFELQQVSATDLESAIEYSIQAMEGLSQRDVEVSREMAYQIVVSDLEDDSPSQNIGSDVASAIQALRETIERFAKS